MLTITEQADLALRLASEEPARATEIAESARALAVEAGLPVAESVALRALGLAARAGDRIDDAIAFLAPAVEAASRGGDEELAATARISLSSALAFAGRPDEALATVHAVPTSSPLSVAARGAEAGILAMLGRYEEALACYGPVVRALRRQHDDLREARSLNNRGVLYVYTGRFAQAAADLARAERLHVGLGNLTAAAEVCHNQGFAAARRGDLPAALASFDRAEQRYAEAGLPPSAIAADKAEVLLAAGLVDEARRVAAASVRALRSGGNHVALAEGLVLLSDIGLVARDHAGAAEAAHEAADLFTAQGRAAWAAVATVARASAALGGHEAITADLARSASTAAETLDRSGVSGGAANARLVAGRLWLSRADQDPDDKQAGDRAEVELALAARYRSRGPAGGRLCGWHAEALRRLAAGDEGGTLTALRAALDVVTAQQATLGASELRAHVSVHAREVAASGLRIAIASGRPARILEWMDRYRANSLRVRTVRPPSDEMLAIQLAELRGVVSDVAEEVAGGGDARPLLRRQAHLERLIRERQWLAAGHGDRTPEARMAGLAAALGDRALVELAESDGELHAVVVTAGRHHHRRLGPVARVLAEVDQLRFALRRQAYGTVVAGPVGVPDGLGPADVAASRLEDLVFGPLRRLLGDRPLVVVPTGALHAVPWAALPWMAGRPVTVAPSTHAWLGCVGRDSTADATARRVTVVAGPGLEGVAAEVAGLQQLYPAATALAARRATASAVRSALEGAAIAHIAAHASFRADNGMWSAVQLADGPLTVYELETLAHPPELVVLSACQSGLSAVRPGGELLGLVAALLGLGTRTIIASVVPVADADTTPLMIELHRRLVAGDPPAVALAGAQSRVRGAPAASFVCFGAG
jgi:tetratricopeptide (TPR) repeat protein